MKLFHKILSGLALASLLMAGSCDVQSTQSSKQSEAQKAEVAANSINFAGGNAEIDNIKRRLELLVSLPEEKLAKTSLQTTARQLVAN